MVQRGNKPPERVLVAMSGGVDSSVAAARLLAQGFDAPATRTVIVARPTYSPNAYQQMIGRGLRGPCNGGKETCLILDVADNIINYDRRLAFTQFEYLWSKK